MNEQEKYIRIYGTLINHTVDPELAEDGVHNDTLSYAKQSFDDQFGEPNKVDNYQDIINKRIKGIKRQNSTPTPSSSNPQKTVISDDLYLPTGKIYIPNGSGGWMEINLANMQSHWHVDTDGKLVANDGKAAKAAGFYDTTVN